MTPHEISQLAEAVAKIVADRLASRPLLVDRVDLAPMLGLSVPTIERRTRDGSIPCIRIGRRVLYDPQAVVAAMSRNEKGGTHQ